jgi:hypothetical protein
VDGVSTFFCHVRYEMMEPVLPDCMRPWRAKCLIDIVYV